LLLGVGVSFSLLLVGIYFPFLNGVFEQVRLDFIDWFKLLTGVFVFIFFSEIFKIFRRVYFNSSSI
jgi:hypothetical protein